MSEDTDRISAPTNGRGPHAAIEPAPPPSAGRPARGDIPLFTPTQLAVGFGILASLIVILVGRLRRQGRGGRRGPLGRG